MGQTEHGRNEMFCFAFIMSEIAACLGAVAVLLHPSLITAKAAHPEQGGRVIKPYELLTNLMPSGIFHYAMIMVTLICKMWECLDLVAAEKNTFSLPSHFSSQVCIWHAF